MGSRLTSTHWGVFHIDGPAGSSDPFRLRPFEPDPDPSSFGSGVVATIDGPNRVRRPAIRRGYLERGADSRQARGEEPFIEVGWDEAIDHVARALRQVIDIHGNGAVFGGSYGWSSAGRFHHAQSQLHRFLNTIGGYVRHHGSYSLGAGITMMPRVLAPMEQLTRNQTDWNDLERHCRLFVAFGGAPLRNAQVSPGGVSEHTTRRGLERMRAAGTEFVNISPARDDLAAVPDAEWQSIRPNSDIALMLALCHTLVSESLHDVAFLERHCVGRAQVEAYLLGHRDGQPKSAAWAAPITGIDAGRIVALARRMARQRTMINIAWSLQRASHGEHAFWAALTLAAHLGQIGMPGGGIGFGYGAIAVVGAPGHAWAGPTLPQGRNAVDDFVPVARIADALLSPGEPYTFAGKPRRYPDLRLVYWAGGNPFHHHQDLNRLRMAWRRPDCVIVHDPFWTAAAKQADIVLPATTPFEREDIGAAARDRHLVAMRAACEPVGEARDDYRIFSDLAARFGTTAAFTEGRDTRQWLEHLYDAARPAAESLGIGLPTFDAFWTTGLVTYPQPPRPTISFEAFRADPAAHPLSTPSGRIELFSEDLIGPDEPGHACWREPAEWLGSPAAARFPLHLLSPQPAQRLHSQYDHGVASLASKVQGREPVAMNPADAASRGLADGDVVRIFNDRGACLAGLRIDPDLMRGVARLATGAWYDPEQQAAGADGGQAADPASQSDPESKSDPASRHRHPAGPLCVHGNVNVLTADRATSAFGQACSAQSLLVEIVRHEGPLPAVRAHEPPHFAPRP